MQTLVWPSFNIMKHVLSFELNWRKFPEVTCLSFQFLAFWAFSNNNKNVAFVFFNQGLPKFKWSIIQQGKTPTTYVLKFVKL